jgi:hypothetical protein
MAKLLRHFADEKAGDFSGERASFFGGVSILIEAGTGKNNDIPGGYTTTYKVQSAPARLRAGLYRTDFSSQMLLGDNESQTD